MRWTMWRAISGRPCDKGGRGPVKNKPIVLADGRWAAPASLEGAMGHVKKQWRPFVDFSNDGGVTWRPGPAILSPNNPGYGAIQPTIWETKPGMGGIESTHSTDVESPPPPSLHPPPPPYVSSTRPNLHLLLLFCASV